MESSANNTAEVFAVMTAVNDEGGQINIARDASGEDTIPRTMQKYKARAEPWMLVVDENCTSSPATMRALNLCSANHPNRGIPAKKLMGRW